MTPLIDIVFQLLIFFLTTTQLAAMVRVELELPRERGVQRGRGDEPGLIINLRDDGRIMVLDEVMPPEAAGRIAARARAERLARGDGAPLRPVVRADHRAPASSLNALVEALRAEGIDGVTFAVRPGR
ncbi:MAG: biopolymer transporter ExbD [Phycisphaeraceae bacterium]|nr:biopolymer transporter ExbD [Phycisphaeraceae bacterium]